MDFNAEAAKSEKFVRFTDLLQPWMQEHVRPFLESLLGAGKVDAAQEMAAAMMTNYSELPEALLKSATAKNPKTKAYVDTTTPFDLSDIWDYAIVSTADPVIRRTVSAIAGAADTIEPGQHEKLLKAFDEIAAAAPAVDVAAPDAKVKDFVAVLRGDKGQNPRPPRKIAP
jgi:hypothetical protein